MSDLTSLIDATEQTLTRIAAEFSPAVFASSLAAEDMVLTDMILKAKLSIGIFSLETGRLHQETLAVLDKVKARYDHDITLYRPQPEAVAAYVEQNGLNAFYHSVEMRRECCRIRKV
ncbi:MAG: phosphoadenosine phosphosulfate reductase family protein, partial [Janthinobacterium sp.]